MGKFSKVKRAYRRAFRGKKASVLKPFSAKAKFILSKSIREGKQINHNLTFRNLTQMFLENGLRVNINDFDFLYHLPTRFFIHINRAVESQKYSVQKQLALDASIGYLRETRKNGMLKNPEAFNDFQKLIQQYIDNKKMQN